MIVFFGPAGAGKSVQGQILAARNGWRWLSAGQLLRDTRDPELFAQMQTGGLVDPDKVNRLIGEALGRAKNISRVVLDGYPRQLEHGRDIALVIVLEVPRSELLHRLEVRGRIDDTPEVIDERLRVYRHEMYPVLDYLTEHGVNIAHLDGTGTVGQVHDRIMEELQACKIV